MQQPSVPMPCSPFPPKKSKQELDILWSLLDAVEYKINGIVKTQFNADLSKVDIIIKPDENTYQRKYEILKQLIICDQKLSDEQYAFYSEYQIKKGFVPSNKPIEDIHLLSLLHNITDDTFIPVKKIHDKYYANVMERFMKEVGLNFDLEDTNISLPNEIFNKITNFKFDIELQYKFLNEYIPLCIKENEFINTVKNNPKTKLVEFKPQMANILDSINIPNRLKYIRKQEINDSLSFKDDWGVCILVNRYNLGTTSVNYADQKFIRQYPEYGFEPLIKCSTNNQWLGLTINNLFLNASHEGIEDLQKKIDFCDKILTENDIVISSNKSNEFECVKEVLTNNFTIDNKNLNLKIRAQDIFRYFEEISPYPGFKVDTLFRNRLSKYLIDMGLTKKRHSDGYYYYGIS